MSAFIDDIAFNLLGSVAFMCFFYLFLGSKENKIKHKRNTLIAGAAYFFSLTLKDYLFKYQ